MVKELFHEYLKEKAFRSRKTRRTQMLKLFAVILFTCKTMYNKTIVGFGFCDIRNNQDLTATETLIIPDIAKASSNNCLESAPPVV